MCIRDRYRGKREFLKGTFEVELVIEFALHRRAQVVRLVPEIRQRSVHVKELMNFGGYEMLRGGFEQIVNVLLDDYYIGEFGDRTLGNGIALTSDLEEPDTSKSVVKYEENHVFVAINYVK
eukprot:TRINITY_DN10466_c0_g1_i7.p1 TRINITY_DN10466_c0_g1~~TRINITY_DN10466_c0_g1_i7.p1  ORF type:complete len:121 (+),score=39.88 TRINITY_DN10466_c0_g1_i7:73-435(+)